MRNHKNRFKDSKVDRLIARDSRSYNPDDRIFNDCSSERDRLIGKSQGLSRNNPIAKRMKDVHVDSAVGTGFKVQPAPPKELFGNGKLAIKRQQEFIKKATTAFNKTAYNPRKFDAKGRDSFDDFMRVIMSEWFVNGEAVILSEWDADTQSTKFNLIDSVKLRTPVEYLMEEDIVSGIKYDKWGRTEKYYLCKQNPFRDNSTRLYNNKYTVNSDGSYPLKEMVAVDQYTTFKTENIEYERENIFFLFAKEYAEQSRGVPFLTSSMELFNYIERLLKNELKKADLATYLSMVISQSGDDVQKTIEAANSCGIDNLDISDYLISEMKYNGQNISDTTMTQSGGIFQLPTGSKVELLESVKNATDFISLVKYALLVIASNLGVPYGIFAQDFENTSYSASKTILVMLNIKMGALRKQLHNSVTNKIYKEILVSSVLNGQLDAPKDFFENIEEYTRVNWKIHEIGAGELDPLKTAQADREALSIGTRSISEIAARKGKSTEEWITELANDKKQIEEKGVKDFFSWYNQANNQDINKHKKENDNNTEDVSVTTNSDELHQKNILEWTNDSNII